MTKRVFNFKNLDEALAYLPVASMDSSFENSIVFLLRTLDAESTWRIVRELLTHPNAGARALGLRVVRRHFKNKKLLECVSQLCFAVERFSELQHWYAAILARYPVKLLLKSIEIEAAKRKDLDFISIHIRALQMHKAEGNKVKQKAIAKLMEIASSSDWTQSRRS